MLRYEIHEKVTNYANEKVMRLVIWEV